jgi:hypothetical protein
MALTTISSLTQAEKLIWARTTLKQARNMSFVEKYVGKDQNSYIQRVSEFTKTEKGSSARMHLLSDLVNPGAMGDTELWGSEEALSLSFCDIDIDQIRNANRLAGKMTDQKAVINFREQSRDVLGYWLANVTDTLAFKTMSGIDYRVKLNGALEAGHTWTATDTDFDVTVARTAATGMSFIDLSFASHFDSVVSGRTAGDMSTSGRAFRWDNDTLSLLPRSEIAMETDDKITYETIVRLKALAKEKYMRGARVNGGDEEFLFIVGPRSMANLRLDPDFLANARALQMGMGDKGQLASGQGGVLINGVRVIESRYVFNTLGATTLSNVNQQGDPGRKWGINGAPVDGERCLFLGAQALAFADLGLPSWEEQLWDYDNQVGIATGKIIGLRKPQFWSIYESTPAMEDFGIMTCDVAI